MLSKCVRVDDMLPKCGQTLSNVIKDLACSPAEVSWGGRREELKRRALRRGRGDDGSELHAVVLAQHLVARFSSSVPLEYGPWANGIESRFFFLQTSALRSASTKRLQEAHKALPVETSTICATVDRFWPTAT